MGRARKGTGLAGSETYSSNAATGETSAWGDILLVQRAVDQHHGHLQRLARQDLVDGLVAPERVASGPR